MNESNEKYDNPKLDWAEGEDDGLKNQGTGSDSASLNKTGISRSSKGTAENSAVSNRLGSQRADANKDTTNPENCGAVIN